MCCAIVLKRMDKKKVMDMSFNAEISRRRFVEAMGAVSALGVMGLAGCGSQRVSEAGSSSSSASGVADTITFAQGADPRGLDPAYVDDGESAKIICNIYDTLLRYETETCEVVAGLSEMPEISDDGLTYTFKLQEGVKFHDGTDCDAEAVKASIERQLEPNRTEDMPYAGFVFGAQDSGTGIESIETPDATTLVIKLRAASTPFVKNMAMALAAPIVAPSAFEAGTSLEQPVGSGPYKFVSWSKGENVVLEANEDYWDKENAPKTKNVVFRFIAENSSRVTALTNGEVDIIDGIDASVVDTITGGGCELFDEDGMNINYMAFRNDSGQFTAVEARRAFCQAVNVEEMVKSLYGDYAGVATSVMPLWMAPYAEKVTRTEYDPDAAKAAFAELGITSCTMLTYTNPRPYNTIGGQALAEAIQGYLAKVGVDMEIVSYDWTTYKTKVETDAFDVCLYGWVGDNGDPDNFMNLLSDENVSMNVGRFRNDEYNALIKKGLETADGDERDDIYLQCEQMVADQMPWMLISHSKNLAAYSPKVKGFFYHPTGVVHMEGVTKSA